MAKMYHITKEVDELIRCTIGFDARGIVWQCDNIIGLAMYPHRILNQIKNNVNEIKTTFRLLQEAMGEPEETCFEKDVRRD